MWDGCGTSPNLRGATPKPIGPRVSAPARNCSRLPQTVSEPGEFPKEGSPIHAYHSFPQKKQLSRNRTKLCGKPIEFCRKRIRSRFYWDFSPRISAQATPMPPEVWDELVDRELKLFYGRLS